MIASAAAAQLSPPATGGVVELDLRLQQLSEPRRLLIVAAHPDDEDTSLLALLARGYGARAAYLSLSRGEGGQNLIGNELGEALGLLRSQELVTARRVDGAQQFFTRSFDFGYTRSLEETNEHWPADSVLKDVVRIVRRFRPHVIVSVFSGTARDGHGQHQAAGVAAHAAFDAAGDADRFPELASEEGLQPWTPLKLYRSTRFNRDATTLMLPTGSLDPRSGRSYHQIAMASRSQHRSQDMGQLERIGPQSTSLQLVQSRLNAANGDAAEVDVFAGVPAGPTWLTRFADSARATLHPLRLGTLVPSVANAVRRAETGDVAEEDLQLLREALAIGAGILVDGVTTDAELVPGQTVEGQATLYNAGDYPVHAPALELDVPPGWSVNMNTGNTQVLESGASMDVAFTITVPAQANPTQPYFLQHPRDGSQYDWSDASPEVRGTPFQPPPVHVRARGSVDGANVVLRREVALRYNDQAVGEVRRPIRVVPRIEVEVTPSQLVWAVDQDSVRMVGVRLTHRGRDPYHGEVAVVTGGWAAPQPQAFAFTQEEESATLSFTLRPPSGVRNAIVDARVMARGADGATYDQGISLIEYPHIRVTPRVVSARTEIHLMPLALPPIAAVGYIRGAADRVPEALAEVGVPIELLEPASLADADLGRFDAIVVGSRAFETDPELARHNQRLLDYTRTGGLLVVQYQQYAFVRGGFAPFPLDIARPHDRVTDETAPVTVLDADHAVFMSPNRITTSDWADWPQERGLYFAHTWDSAYVPLLEMADPGREPLRGGLLVASYGRGTYVYTGLSFFRALPAGTPGAFKLLLNLLGLAPDHAS
jgi:LmbE family N-acetylglucosaminyl deacetylase